VSGTSVQGRSFDDTAKGKWAYGIGLFAATVMVTVGLFQIFEGISAILNDDVYAKTPNYVFHFDLTTWGWIQLLIGILVAGTGVALIARQRWALIAGVVLAMLSALANFMFLPYYPLWSLVIIALDVAVAWALATQVSHSAV
jgi:hypothetical protein